MLLLDDAQAAPTLARLRRPTRRDRSRRPKIAPPRSASRSRTDRADRRRGRRARIARHRSRLRRSAPGARRRSVRLRRDRGPVRPGARRARRASCSRISAVRASWSRSTRPRAGATWWSCSAGTSAIRSRRLRRRRRRPRPPHRGAHPRPAAAPGRTPAHDHHRSAGQSGRRRCRLPAASRRAALTSPAMTCPRTGSFDAPVRDRRPKVGRRDERRRHRGRVRRPHHRGVPGASRPRGRVRRHRRRAGRAPAQGRGADPRRRPAGPHRRGSRVEAAVVRGGRRRAAARADDRVPVRADAAGRRRRGRPELRRAGGARDRAGARAEGDRRQQVDGAGRLDPVRAARAGRGGYARRARDGRVESRVPARGPGGPRLPASRSHRDRLRRPGVGGARLGALPRRARSGARDRPGVGRDDQVRVERVPRDQGLVHQRDRQPVRGGRRRRARGRDRHGLRRAHRLPVPAPGPGLRRFVLPEGRRGAAAHRAKAGYDFQLLDGVVDVNLGQHDRIVDKVRAAAGRPLAGIRGRDVGPHVQGRHRRSATRRRS